MDNQLEARDAEQLSHSLELAREIITRDYLYTLSKLPVQELPESIRHINIQNYTRLFHFERFVSDKNENMLDKLVTVLTSSYTSNSTVLTIIKGSKTRTDYYIGVVNKDLTGESDICVQSSTFERSLKGNFPGLTLAPLTDSELETLCGEVFAKDIDGNIEDGMIVSSVSGIASIRDKEKKELDKYIQGLEHLVDSLQGKEYTIIFVSDPISAEEIALTKVGYENLYTQLSPFATSTLSFNDTQNISVTTTQTEGISSSVGNSISLTQNYSQTSGWSETSSESEGRNTNLGGTAVGLVGAGLRIVAALAESNIVGTLVFPAMNAIGGAIGGNSTNESLSTTRTGSVAETSGQTSTETESTSQQSSRSNAETEGTSQGRTLQFVTENKTIKGLLSDIEKQLERLDRCEAYGAFNCASYIISSDPETNAIVANGYNALMRGDSSANQAAYINNWDCNSENGRRIVEYLERFAHPIFYRDETFGTLVSPASISNSYEVAINLGLPKKSIKGLPVLSTVAFGRDVYYLSDNKTSTREISLGNIYHMGSEDKTSPVNLNVDSLAMHTFITGSTGSGKSNTVYQILRELHKNNIKFLVIEPAKGEYKHVFCNGIAKIYGTNSAITPVLKVNPFKFPEGIHVLEHTDRLVEIFNVCWPMYAAMPAVMKDSMERAYIASGWDLDKSINKYNANLFPTFADVLNELNNVIASSSFSQEVKDNYIGALSTRIKSLTNGIYGTVFGNDELGDALLFDENVIVDLSRVGSSETKSLIMGILVMRLQEYRMTAGKMNAHLEHVTVLEEAHNLLKRTSTEQSSESSNLLGKSVEMLANAIAEVRTYGEGFIIADQSPGLLDLSVIRNTNTKIIMRLPDEDDRRLVGKAAGLSDDQIREISKFTTGVAAVYQNDWIEPVLAKITYCNTGNSLYSISPSNATTEQEKRKKLVYNLVQKCIGEKLDMNVSELVQMIVGMNLTTSIKIAAIKAFGRNGNCSKADAATVFGALAFTTDVELNAEQAETIGEWKDAIVYAEESLIEDLGECEQNLVVECILIDLINRQCRPVEYLEKWNKYIEGTVM